MFCPYCGHDSLTGPMPGTERRAEMVCLECGHTFGAYDWYGAADNRAVRYAAA